MKKLALLLVCAGLLAGCASDTNEIEKVRCGHGHYEAYLNGCSCDPGWNVDADGVCLVEVNSKDGGNSGGNNGGNNGGTQGQPADNKCYASFYYTDPATRKDSGGEADFDMYLIGDFNGWAESDPKYKMTYLGDGTHGIKLEVTQGGQFIYKYYINGWAENSYHNDQTNNEMDNEGNNVAKFSSCGMSFGNANGKTVTEVSGGGNNGGGNNGGGNNGGTNTGNDGCKATFIYENKYTSVNDKGEPTPFDVYLVGSFNMDENGQWKVADPAYKMTPDGRGRHTFTMDVKDWGQYTYKFYVNGWEGDSYRSDPNACVGDMCDNQGDGTCGKTYQYIEVPADGSGGGNNGGGNSTVVPSNPNAQLQGVNVDGHNVTLTFKDTPSNVRGGASPQINGNTVTDTVPENSKYAYYVTVGGNEVFVPVWVESSQFDWHDALLYFAFTDRFLDGDPGNNEPKTTASIEGSSNAQWMGGDFKGLQKKVEEGYFDKLGVNTLWISSVSMNAQGTSQGTNGDEKHWYSAYHSYWPVASFMTPNTMNEFNGAKSEGRDITAIEPHFGSMDDLKALVNACHKRGIRVLVDFAANHVHKDSPIFQKHGDWFNGDLGNRKLCDDGYWDDPNETERCWFSQDLPDINYENPTARQTMVDHAVWLIKETNIDGFRVDAVKHMNIQFIKDLRAATDQLYANSGIMFYMVGETFTGDVGLLNKYIGNDLLHAQFDFPMYFALRDHVLGTGNYAEVANLSNSFNSDLMGTFMGNHDVARAISVAAKQNQNKWGSNEAINDWQPYLKVKTALTILLTNPGVPLIYYGDEYGMVGSNDPDNRRMMGFDSALNNDQQDMLSYVSLLGQIRKNHKAITRGHRENLSSGGGYWCYKVTNGSESIIVGVSRADAGDNGGCDLKGEYKLQNLLDTNAPEETKSGLDLSSNHLQVYLVK